MIPPCFKIFHLKESLTSNFKTARKKRFFNGTTSNWFLYKQMNLKKLCKQKNFTSIIYGHVQKYQTLFALFLDIWHDCYLFIINENLWEQKASNFLNLSTNDKFLTSKKFTFCRCIYLNKIGLIHKQEKWSKSNTMKNVKMINPFIGAV